MLCFLGGPPSHCSAINHKPIKSLVEQQLLLDDCCGFSPPNEKLIVSTLLHLRALRRVKLLTASEQTASSQRGAL